MKCLVLVLISLFSAPALSQFFDGHDLHEGCSADEQTFGAGLCLGFIVGVVDAKEVCLPDEVDLGQVRRVVKLYLKANPSQRRYSAESLVRRAIVGSIDCPAE